MVDMTWTGHNHSYQRTCPVLGGACVGYAADGTAKGPVHVVMGFGGAGLSTEVEPKQPPMFEKAGALICDMLCRRCGGRSYTYVHDYAPLRIAGVFGIRLCDRGRVDRG